MMLDKDENRYGYKEGGPGIEALRKEAPEVVERMGYNEGGEFLELYSMLSKDELKEINDQIAEERVEKDGVVRKLGNIAERTASILSGSGNKIPYTSDEEDERFVQLAKKILKTREQKAEGGSLLQDDMAMMEEQEMPTHTMPDGTVMPGAEHEESEMEMESETPMESDSEMEDNYLDFIINEALTPEEEELLMSKLEQDEELAMVFDKVIGVAQEFAGSGPVEGPGTGVSDSIPARLSDGEFVFTAKAVEKIGADNLMAMMKEAEMKADERQPVQAGGLMQQDEEAYQPTAAPMTEQVIRVERGPQSETVGVAGSMLDPSRGEETNPLYEEMAFKRPPVHGAGY